MALCATSAKAESTDLHGPLAPNDAFLSHSFQLKAHMPERPQLSFHYGLMQPILLRGFNAAVDVRYRRMVLTYSHGQGLVFDDVPGALSDQEKSLGSRLGARYSTGFGAGLTIIDELYVLVDFKAHKFDVSLEGDRADYLALTLGIELGYRLFLWKGLHIAPVVRYWPEVYNSAGDSLTLQSSQGPVEHETVGQGMGGFFVNLLIGWSFQL